MNISSWLQTVGNSKNVHSIFANKLNVQLIPSIIDIITYRRAGNQLNIRFYLFSTAAN